MNPPLQIAITGAAGRIAYSLVFRIAAGGMFGSDQPVGLSLLDVAEAQPAIQALELEVKDCAFPLVSSLRTSTDPHEAFAGADWAILLAGKPYRPQPGDPHSRIDLLLENGPIYIEHGRAINEVAPTARILVVANPCNTNCLLAKSHAENVPAEHWFAMNRMDRMRATALIAERANVPVAEVTRVSVWGNHSERVYVDVHNAFIHDRPALEVLNDPEWVRNVLRPTVAQRSRQIFGMRGASPSGAAAQAILGTVRSIATPTPFGRRYGASVVSDGSYGVPRGLVFGFPLRNEHPNQWSIVPGLYLDGYAQDCLAANIAELEHEAAAVTHLIGTR